MKNSFYYFYYYTPKSHLKITKQAIFAAGAGLIGNYSCCSWETKGAGQFKPELGSNPAYRVQPYIGAKSFVAW